MTVQIKLKQKYRMGNKSRYQGGEKPAPKKRRVKIGKDKHEALFGKQPTVVLFVDGLTGAGVFKKV